MSYPTPNIHRPSRRKLTRGASNVALGLHAVIAASGTSGVKLTFNRPILLNGNPAATLPGRTISAVTQPTPDVVDIQFSGLIATLLFSIPANDPAFIDTRGAAVPAFAFQF